ncbi:MAG: proline--tRNA ligase [Chromatiales bacterium]|nr:proline--tRNA ligase [Chromatiales bacterium]
MRLSQLPLTTFKEVPAEAEIVSHQLMLRAGLVRRLASGLFTWLPLGLRVLRRVERIVREEMDRAGAFEVSMPVVQPAELWRETGRWDVYGDLLLRIRDRHDRSFCFAPTAEEVVTDLARRELRSYRQLPVTFYQVQTKFRDEIRPRFGIMRAREFVMKDAYSFHLDQASLAETYATMAMTYHRIFTRLGLRFRAVDADGGEIGGSRSQEFHVLADSGEDRIAWCEGDDFAANVELAPALPPTGTRAAPAASLARVATPGARSISEVASLLGVPASTCVKTLVVETDDGGLCALVVRGDHEVNPLKAARVPGIAQPLKLASAERVASELGLPVGFIGPGGLDIRVVADHAAVALVDFICGANESDMHLSGVNWGRDLPEPEAADLRDVVSGDPSPGGGGSLTVARGIEVGHIFQLGNKYSRSMNACVLDQEGREQPMVMGCYGIGITRIVAAAIEQNHDDAGIIWPEPMSPADVTLLVLNPKKVPEVTAAAERLYEELQQAGWSVLFDDRDARPGVKFADADLIGIPHRLVFGERGLRNGKLEYRHRATGEELELELGEVVAALGSRMLPAEV